MKIIEFPRKNNIFPHKNNMFTYKNYIISEKCLYKRHLTTNIKIQKFRPFIGQCRSRIVMFPGHTKNLSMSFSV